MRHSVGLAGVLLVLLTGCLGYQHGVETEGRQFVDRYEGHKMAIARAVREHRVLVGMTTDEVYAAWGAPAKRDQTQIDSLIYERWTYEDQGVSRMALLYFNNGILLIVSD